MLPQNAKLQNSSKKTKECNIFFVVMVFVMMNEDGQFTKNKESHLQYRGVTPTL